MSCIIDECLLQIFNFVEFVGNSEEMCFSGFIYAPRKE